MTNHIAIKAETTLGTFVTPDTWIAVQKVNFASGQAPLMASETGNTRDVASIEEGAYKPSGSIEMLVRATQIPYLVKAAGFNTVTKSTPGGATNARNHCFNIVDATALKSISMQVLQTDGGTTVGWNLRGVAINSLALTFAAEQYVVAKLDFYAYEIAKAGGTWLDTSSSVAAQSPSYSTPIQPLSFKSASGTYGGTPSKDGTTKVYTVSSGTAFSQLENLTVTMDNQITQRVFLNALTTGSMIRGQRKITFEFTAANDTPATTWWDKHIAATQETLQFVASTTAVIEGSTTYQMEVTLPKVNYDEANPDDFTGEYGPRNVTVKGTAIRYPTTDDAIAIRFRDGNDTGY